MYDVRKGSSSVIRPWSRDKLELLSKYLHAYSVIMRKEKETWLRAYHYVDAFASTGQYADPDSQSYVDGSPLVALRCQPPFDEFWFVELSASRLERLRQRVEAECPGCYSHFLQGDANAVLRDQIAPKITWPSRQRGLIFLDPYGLEVEFETIRQLARTRTFDLFVNFSVMGIIRNLERQQFPDEHTVQMLARVMGDAEWVRDTYATQPDLFGAEERSFRPRLGYEQVAGQYIDGVKGLFKFVSEPVLMRNSVGAPLYVLFLASHNETAVKITNEIFKVYERLRARPA